jgi:recombinase, phage recT family
MNTKIVANNDALAEVKKLMKTDDVKSRFSMALGGKAPQFMISIINAVANNGRLKHCNPNSIMAAAMVAASIDLPVDSNLGFSALVPYNDICQFQMMYKGYIQLAIRTGAYEKMNCAEVYADELEMYNPITGECIFTENFSSCKDRKNKDFNKVVGYYAWFRLKSGFVKELYMSKAEITEHAKKYSSAYRKDLYERTKLSQWSINFDTMAKKTVLKLLLSRWGVLSVSMQRAIEADQKTFDANGNGSYGDNQPDNFTLENEVTEPQFNQIPYKETKNKTTEVEMEEFRN